MDITEREFARLSSFIYDRFGINLPSHKKTMLVSRLNKIVTEMKINSFEEYYNHIENDSSGRIVSELINAVSTNHTFFYRESEHFDYFYNAALPGIIGDLRKGQTRDVRVWSAGCSSGEEPYMLAIFIKEFLQNEYNLWDTTLLATDINLEVLQKAQKGVYSAEQLTRMPAVYKHRYFSKIQGTNEFEIDAAIRKAVVFRRLNLMNAVFPFKKPFHAIFCRNVMIYFDKETQDALVKRFIDNLVPGGFLFIGHSETINRHKHEMDYIMPALYKKPLS